MKTGIHPTLHPVVFIDVSTGDKIISASTITSKETLEIDGVMHYVIKTDITSKSHPFFTGEMRFVDLKGRVDGFKKKMQHAEEVQKKLQERAAKKQKPAAITDTKSYRELLREQQAALREVNKTAAPTQ